jgi:hypothetical protein
LLVAAGFAAVSAFLVALIDMVTLLTKWAFAHWANPFLDRSQYAPAGGIFSCVTYIW